MSSTQTPAIHPLKSDLIANVTAALAEDIGIDVGDCDITAVLIPATHQAQAHIICRDQAVICGVDWVNEVARQVDATLQLDWQVTDGEQVLPDQCLVKVSGNARGILTFERTALNFLQSLSGTATLAAFYAQQVAHTAVKLLDTRKTIPGLRKAQKYAVSCGGCYNHRIGLYDAYLIKENHIMACGGIQQAIAKARQQALKKPVEVEVENLQELQQALAAQADTIMLDNFSMQTLQQAVSIAKGKSKLEASGSITTDTLVPIAETGVDYISIGALTKDCKAVDLSLRLV